MLWRQEGEMRTKKVSLTFLSAPLCKNHMFSQHFNISPGKSAETNHPRIPFTWKPARLLNPDCLCYRLVFLCNGDDIINEPTIIPSSQVMMGPLAAQSWWCNKRSLPSTYDRWVWLQLKCSDSCRLMTVLLVYITFFLATFLFTLGKGESWKKT